MESEQNTDVRPVTGYDEGFVPSYAKKHTRQEREINVDRDEISDPENCDEKPEGVAQEPETRVESSQETENEVEREKEPGLQADTQPEFRVTMTTDLFNQFKGILKTLGNEVRLSFTAAGITATMVDPPYIAMAAVEMWKEALNEYQIDRDFEMVIDLDDFPEMKNGGDLLTISSISGTKNRNVYQFEYDVMVQTCLKLALESVQKVKEPPVTSDQYAVIGTKKFSEFLKMAKNISEQLRIELKAEGKVGLLAGDGARETEAFLTKDREIADFHIIDDVGSSYSMEYMKKLIKQMKAVNEFRIELKDDYPLKMTFSLPTSVKSVKGKHQEGVVPVRYYLAPRMEN